jgi:hypothetical protein
MVLREAPCHTRDEKRNAYDGIINIFCYLRVTKAVAMGGVRFVLGNRTAAGQEGLKNVFSVEL